MRPAANVGILVISNASFSPTKRKIARDALSHPQPRELRLVHTQARRPGNRCWFYLWPRCLTRYTSFEINTYARFFFEMSGMATCLMQEHRLEVIVFPGFGSNLWPRPTQTGLSWKLKAVSGTRLARRQVKRPSVALLLPVRAPLPLYGILD
jgi:hypothetical protein